MKAGDDSGGGDSGGSGDSGDSGYEIREPGDQVFTGELTSEIFYGEPGYWQVASTSTVLGNQDSNAVHLMVELDGDLRDGGTLAVEKVQWSRADYGTPMNDFNFVGTGGAATFTIEAMDADGNHLWGSLNAAIEMTETETGASETLESLNVESWPRFGV